MSARVRTIHGSINLAIVRQNLGEEIVRRSSLLARFANNLASPQFPWTRLVSRINERNLLPSVSGPIFRLRFPARRKRRLYHCALSISRALSHPDGQIELMLHAFELICCLPLGTDRQDGGQLRFHRANAALIFHRGYLDLFRCLSCSHVPSNRMICQ